MSLFEFYLAAVLPRRTAFADGDSISDFQSAAAGTVSRVGGSAQSLRRQAGWESEMQSRPTDSDFCQAWPNEPPIILNSKD